MSTKKRMKNPMGAFKRCPACKSEKVHAVLDEVICLDCDWDSIAAHIEAGGMEYGPFAVTKNDHKEIDQTPADGSLSLTA
jgi:hypothetical protein